MVMFVSVYTLSRRSSNGEYPNRVRGVMIILPVSWNEESSTVRRAWSRRGRATTAARRRRPTQRAAGDSAAAGASTPRSSDVAAAAAAPGSPPPPSRRRPATTSSDTLLLHPAGPDQTRRTVCSKGRRCRMPSEQPAGRR